MGLKHISHIRKVVKGIDSLNREKCTIEVLDHTEVSLHDKNTSSSSEEHEKLTIVSAILKKRPKKNQTEKKIDNTLFVFWLESYESLIKDLLLSKTAQLENLGFVYTQNSDRTSKTILKNELWSLYHENSVICTNWKKNYGFPTAINKLFLVTLTRYYMAYIWRFNELQDSFEICIQIPLQNDNYTLNFHCLWMNIESVVSDYNFSKRAFLIFYNTTNTRCYSISTEDLDSDYSCNKLKSGDSDIFLPNLNADAYSAGSEDDEPVEELYDDTGEEYDNILFHKYEDYVQYFEIYAVDGLFNHRLAVTSEYLLGSNELTMPVKIKLIESVCICDHTFETGLVTLYTSDSLRPNKITTKSPIVVSKWITLKSTNLSNFYKSNHHHNVNSNHNSHNSNSPQNSNSTHSSSNNVGTVVDARKDTESLDELIGMQISKGLNKILPPVKLSLLNENDISMNLLLSPYDLFLKDEHIRESVDNIVGLVIRYMFHPSTPLYINVNNELVYIENYFINKIKGSKKVKNVKVFSGKDETLYIIHSKSGALSAITSKKHDPNDITHHQIHNLSHVVTFQVIEYHHQLYFIIFTPYDKESVLLTPYDNESVLLTPYHNESVLLTPFYKETLGKFNDQGDEFVQNDGSLYVCGFYKWENYKLNLKGSWLFQCPNPSKYSESVNGLQDDHLDDAIIQFKKWYDSNYFCLLSKFKLISPNELDSTGKSNDSEIVYLYMIKSHKIIKWLEITNRCYYDLLTQDKYYLSNTSGRNDYIIDDLKILIKNRPFQDVYPNASEYQNDTGSDSLENSSTAYSEDVVGELPLFTGCNFKNKMYPVYHPECVLAMLKLGLNSLVSKLVNMLVFLFRRILSQLKDNIYCTNSNPYSEEQSADVAEDVSGGCNCIIFKTLALKLFCRFNRFFYDYIIKTIYMSNMTHGAQNFEDTNDAEEPKKTILNDYVVDDEYNQYFKDYCSFRVENELLMNELIVYLQVLRLIGLSWYEQYQLINILTKYLSTSDDMLLFNSNRDLENVIGSIESAREQDEDEDDDLCKLCQNSNILLRIGMEQNSQLVTPDHNILKYLISYMTSLSPSFFSTFPQNKNLTDLDNVFFTKYKDHLDDKFKAKQHIFKDESVSLVKDEDIEESFLIWLLLVKNDHNLLIELDHYYTTTVQTGDSGVSYTEYMDMINVGYWAKNKSSFKIMFENVEKYFRLKVKTYRNIEDFDQFGFYLILQGKVKIFSLLLKSKGFEKFSNFLTNDFTQERWKDASVKNAFALISQRRYLLSSAMLILANRIQDAVDVVHQYLNNLSLSILISKLFNFSLQYTFNKVQNRKIKYILLHTHSIDLSPEYSTDNISTVTCSSNPTDHDSASLNTKHSKELMNKNLHVEDPLSKQVELLCHNDDDSDSNPYNTGTYNAMYLKHTYNTVHNTGLYGKQVYNNSLYLKHAYENLCPNGSLNEEIRGYKTIGHDSRILEEGILDLLSGTVDELILNVSIGIVLKKLDLFHVEQMIRNSSRYYLDKMPMISALLHSFVVNYTSWDKILIYASNFLHFQKFNNFNQKYDYLDYTNQGLNDSYCNSNYYVDDYKYLDGNVLVEFNNYTFKQSHLKCPILKKLSSIISTKHLQKPSKGSQHSLFSFSSPQSGQHSGISLEDPGDFARSGDEIFVMNEDIDLVVNVNTLSVVEVLLKIKSTLKMELTLNYYKINSILSIRKYDIDIESIYIRLVNTFIGFLDSNLSVQEFNIPSLQLNLINKLALLAIHSSNLDNSKENEPGTLESERQPEVEVKDRLDVGLYDSDLSLVNEEIVCVCFVVSLTCVFMLVLYKVDILPQVYNGLYTQLTLLNQMKGNNEWLKQFLESVINTIEPSLFANDTFDAEKFNILSISKHTKPQHEDELQLKEFIGIIITLSMVETILGLMRNYIYKQTNYYHYFWLDRLSVSMSKYLFNYKDQLIKLSLKSSKTLYRLNYNYHNPEDSEGSNYTDTNKYSDHMDIVNNYVLSNFNNSFYKLWSYLNCNYKLYSLYSNNCNINPYYNNASPSINNTSDTDNTGESDNGYYDETDDYNHLYNLLDDYQIINYDNLLMPMILPLKLIFFKLYYYSSHQIYLNNLVETANRDEGDMVLKRIVDNLRKIRFISLHNAKGRTLSTFYTMSNITMNEHLNHLSLQLLLEPVKSDLYLLTELNTNLCPYQLNKNITTNVLNLLIRYNNLHKQGKLDTNGADNNWIILLRLLRYLNTYSKSHVEEAFNIRQDHFTLSEKLQTLLKIKDNNNSGGIETHPIFPVYAIAYGSSNDKAQPSYSVSLQHTSTLANEFMFTKNEILLNNLINIYNVSTLQLTTFHSSNLFGDLLSICWSGDSLCLYDKFGWIMIYYMKNLVYSSNTVPSKNGKSEKDQVANSIPTICFKTHLTSNYMSWLGEYYVLTMGNGILEESIERDIIFINLTLVNGKENKQLNSQEPQPDQTNSVDTNDDFTVPNTNHNTEDSNSQNSNTENSISEDSNSENSNLENSNPAGTVENSSNSELKTVGRDVISSKSLKMFSENSARCICIWNLVEYSNNNIPKIKILMSFVHPDTREPKDKEETPKVTSILPIKNDTVTNGSKEVQLEYDLLLFDSMGVLRVFSVTDMDIVFTHALENTAIIAAFILLNGNIVTVTEDSKIKVYKLTSLYSKPQLIFDTVSIVKQPRNVVSSTSFVSSIGEFISQKFSREKPQPPQQPLKIINVKLYSRQFIAIVYSDEQVSTTQLPNFAVY